MKQTYSIILFICVELSLTYAQTNIDDILKLTKDLGTENKEAREKASSILLNLNEEIVPCLLKEVHKDKIAVISILGLIKLEKYFTPAIEALVETLQDSEVRNLSLWALSNQEIIIVPKEAEWMYTDDTLDSSDDSLTVKEIKRKLEIFTSLKFCNTPFKAIISYIQNEAKLPIRFTPEVVDYLENPDLPLLTTMRIKNWKLKNVLKILFHYSRMVYVFKDNKISIKFRDIGEFERTKIAAVKSPKKKETEIITRQLQTSLVSLDFKNLTLGEALSKFSEITNLNIFMVPSVDYPIENYPTISLTYPELEADVALNLLMIDQNRSYFIENNLIIIRKEW